jgi:hypothetical protein
VVNGTIWLVHGNHAVQLAVGGAGIAQSLDLTPWLGTSFTTPAGGGFDPVSANIVLDTDQGTILIPHKTMGPVGTTLDVILTDLCVAVGLGPYDIEVSRVADKRVAGYVVSSRMAARQAIEPLLAALFVDAVETGGRLEFVPRGGSSAATVTDQDLGAIEITAGSTTGPQLTQAQIGATPETASNPRLIETRTADSELPCQIDVSYIDTGRDGQTSTQSARRRQGTTHSSNTLSQTYSIAMDSDAAATVAARALKTAWAERSALSFAIPISYIALDPADVITLRRAGQEYVIRLTQIDLGANLMLQCQALTQYAGSYRVSAKGSDTTGKVSGNLVPDRSPAELFILDMPLLVEAETGLEVLAAFGAPSSSWTGGGVYRSTDGGASWTLMATLAEGAVAGIALTALPSPLNSPWVWDEDHTLRVTLYGGSLSSADALDVLNGANAAVLGGEVLQWRDATLVEAGVWDLSGLLRGRRGTEDRIDGHRVGDRFVVLDLATVAAIDLTAGMVGSTVAFKGPTIGGVFDAGEQQTIVFSARGLRCFSPVGITGSRDGFGNLTIGWVRRTRWYGDWADGVDVPLFEATEAYSIDILDGAGVAKRTLSSSSPTALYSAAAQIADFGAVQGAVNVAIFQLNAVVGRGVSGEATV